MHEHQKHFNILLVEDDEVDIMNVQRAFKKGGVNHKLYIAHNGLEALKMLRGEDEKLTYFPSKNRLILLDLNMPKMGGIDFLGHLRADAQLKSIPVVVLTTSNEDKDLIKAYNFNVAGYLLKPVSFSKFVEMMKTWDKYWTISETPR
ncbi:MAG: response regulator [Nostocaceae cyanobacterium]|nr:response regulator [Nostocaceae cyanobacterium]